MRLVSQDGYRDEPAIDADRFSSWPTERRMGQDWNGRSNQPRLEYDDRTLLSTF